MERTVVMNPIPAALGYLFNNGFLRGITASTGRTDFMKINPSAEINGGIHYITLTDFFIKSGKKYFSFTDKYFDDETKIEKQYCYEQSGNTVTEIDSLPAKPAAPVMIIGEFAPFTFESYKWENADYNRLKRDITIISTAKKFDTVCKTDTGILFSQPEKLSRKAGLWYMGNEQQGGPTRIDDYQIIWQ